MRRPVGAALAAFALLQCLNPGLARASSQPNAYAIAGQYSCAIAGRPEWHFESVNVVWGVWVHVRANYPPQNGVPATSIETFVGYDRATAHWNIVSVNAGGSYYTRSSASRKFDGSRWSDVFPADGGTALVRISPSGYTFDFVPKAGGNDRPARVVCTRA